MGECQSKNCYSVDSRQLPFLNNSIFGKKKEVNGDPFSNTRNAFNETVGEQSGMHVQTCAM